MSEIILSPCLSFICHNFFLVVFLLLFPLSSFAYPLSFNKTRFDVGDPDILYGGDGTSSFGAIELNIITSPFRVGRAAYIESLHLRDSATGILTDFTTRFSFTIDIKGSGDTTGSDGLAFYLAPVGYQIPPNSVSGYLGLLNITTGGGVPGNQIVFIEFDTWINPEFDPPTPVQKHIGINSNKLSSLAYTSWDFEYEKTQAVLISYNATTKNLGVLSNDSRPLFSFRGNNTISLLRNIDLMEALPEWVTIGFSAATGVFGERYTIHTWEFSSTGVTSSGRQKRKQTIVVVVVVVCSFLLAVVGVSVCWFLVNNRRTKNIGSRENSANFELEREALPKRFHYQELVVATNDFADDRRLGQGGGSGQVYKGILIGLGRVVAVKRIIAKSEVSERNFINEANIISRLIHKNLVQFIGWYHEKGELLLVYEHMSNGSLDTHLFGNRITLQWNERYKISLGLASAIHYLHENAEQCVLHRDIKSANVLVDADFSTKLGDFGVAKLLDPLFSTQRTVLVGTYGYLAPEYLHHGRAGKESDIFSFGVVALEIACGRKTYLDNEGYHVPLVRWIWELYEAGDILNAADERLNMNFDEMEMRGLLIVGLWCTHPNNKERPKAGQVIKVLQLEAPLPELPPNMHGSVVLPKQTHDQALAISIQSAVISISLDNGGR